MHCASPAAILNLQTADVTTPRPLVQDDWRVEITKQNMMHVFDTLTLVCALACAVSHLYLQFVNMLAVTSRPAAVGPSCILVLHPSF